MKVQKGNSDFHPLKSIDPLHHPNALICYQHVATMNIVFYYKDINLYRFLPFKLLNYFSSKLRDLIGDGVRLNFVQNLILRFTFINQWSI